MVVPRALRAQLGIEPGAELDARVEGGELIARPVGPEVVLVEENGRLVATTNPPIEPMSTDELLQLIDETREWPRNA
jgi:bifunctional DNA-binding transcriptional regulator/antitoxin component of YhaV-PrlF toxin-antitoxin module